MNLLKYLEAEADKLHEENFSSSDEFRTVNNSFVEGFNYALAIVQGHEIKLNENQQASINKAKKYYRKGIDLYDCSIDMLIFDDLSDKEWAKATVAFLMWAQEQEEE